MRWPKTQQESDVNGMPLQEVRRWISERLSHCGIEHPDLNAEQLLCWVLSCRRMDLYLHPERELTPRQAESLQEALEKRLAHTPLQYITGRSHFLDFDLIVNGDVFIPRPETEVLVEETITWLRSAASKSEPEVIVDLCTGCGAIAVAMAKAFSGVQVYATEISRKAISVARENARRNDLSDRISFFRGDLLRPLEHLDLEGRVDALLCNPPYVAASDMEALPPEVRDFEPRVALDGGGDGLDVLRRVVREAPPFLKDRGLLTLEVGQGQAEAVRRYLRERDCFGRIEIVRDLNAIERVVRGVKKAVPVD